MLHGSCVQEEWEHVRGTTLQTPRSVQKEEKGVLQALELTLSCSPWCRPLWGSSAAAAHGEAQGREDPHYSQWRSPCQSRWMCCGERWKCWRATSSMRKAGEKSDAQELLWADPTPSFPTLICSAWGGGPIVRNKERSLTLEKKGTGTEGISLLLFLSNWVYFCNSNKLNFLK